MNTLHETDAQGAHAWDYVSWAGLNVYPKMLYSLANALNNTMTLTLPDSRQFEVMFDRRNNTPIMAQPLWAKAHTTIDDFYLLTLQLITVGS
ncbi:hypothetical protein [Endozoicomonas euniceicola]|uniref:Uncharacterized protein n=1 Tax=Endozoicomonas euniceicola TaxID=1234143 RepID=A0ABY6GU14_9GAMM|nr:hypothetical protein [Endozoicomonas euniceicola]UYM16250.1 hypothetical protein NX720_26220 [Endozoicomonas euniceicola]